MNASLSAQPAAHYPAEPALASLTARYAGRANPVQSESFQVGYPDVRWPNLYLAVLDEVNYSLILARRSGEIVFANRAALGTCQNREAPLAIDAGRLAFRWASDQERMNRALADACNGRRSMVDLGSMEERGCVAVVPVLAGGPTPAALLILGRHGTADALALQLFSKTHQLTPAECSVLTALSEGLRPAQIASQHGVAVCTVRTQIRSIRQKTLTRSIGHLMHLIERLPPMALSSVSSMMVARSA